MRSHCLELWLVVKPFSVLGILLKVFLSMINSSRLPVLVLTLLLCCSGCLRRRMTIRSDPPGAVVYIDRRPEPIGVTPVSTSFIYYGTRDIQLVKDGYETIMIRKDFAPPWYEIPPLDFVVENLWPKEVRDERVVDVKLEPLRRVPPDELLQRANQLRQQTQQGIVTPLVAPPENPAPRSVPPVDPNRLTPRERISSLSRRSR